MQLSDFLTYLKRDFKRTDKDTEITDAYNDMVMWIAMNMPVGDYKFQSYIASQAGIEDYPLPSNLIHLIKPVRLLLGTGSSDSGYQLEDLTKEEYDARFPNPNRTNPSNLGRPSACTVFSRSILAGPIPDVSTYLFEINWAKRPTTQSADSDTLSLGTEWDQVLKWGSLDRLYAGIGMLEESNYWASKYRDAEGMPAGMAKLLFDAEKDREHRAIGSVQNNDL